MRYFDTSFLAPLVLPEATSETIATFISDLPAGELAVSHWARVEFSSLLARAVRMGDMAPLTSAQADAQFEGMLDESFAVLLPSAADFSLAKTFLGHHETGLRAGDALHLATARNRRAAAIYSLDKTMIKAGRSLGLPVSTGIRLPDYGD